MKGNLIADRYSEALLEIAKEKNLVDEYLQDLQMILDTLKRYENLVQILGAPEVANKTKKDILKDLFSHRVHTDVLHFIFSLVDSRRVIYLNKVINGYINKVNEERGIINIEVISAVHLPDEVMEQIRETLSETYQKRIQISAKQDPSIIGGIKITAKDRIWDLSMKTRLNEFQRQINEFSN